MSKKNKAIEDIRKQIRKAESEGYTAIGMSFSAKEEPQGYISKVGKSGIADSSGGAWPGDFDTFSPTTHTDISLLRISSGTSPEESSKKLFEYSCPSNVSEDSPLFRQNVIPIVYKNVGSPNLGYIPWGPGNSLPNYICNTAYSLPYTGRSLQSLRDQIVGLGVEFTYRWTRYSGGTVTTKEIPYKDAGVLIRGRIRELEEQRKLKEDESGNTISMMNLDRSGNLKPGTIEYELEQLRKDYETWERVNEEVQEFEKNNSLHKHELACITDFVAMEMYFPLIGLSRGAPGKDWNPKIVSLRHIPCVAARVEQMDENRNINYVYYSDRWRLEGGFNVMIPKMNEIVAYPALPETGTILELQDIVNRKKKVGVRSRPTWFCIPRRMPSMNSLYYTRPTWWSIYTSQVYDYAATLIADRASARRNGTMWGKIIMLNHVYLERLWADNGCDTKEKKQAFRKMLKENIDNFLRNRDHNGATAMFENVVSSDGTTLWDSIKIIDVPINNSAATANKTELSEISNIIFLAMGIHTLLIGNDISSSGNSGSAHRELDLLKQKQLSPMQKDYLDLLNFIRDWNDWDPKHGVWRSLQMSLTTLDNSKTGIKTINNAGEET